KRLAVGPTNDHAVGSGSGVAPRWTVNVGDIHVGGLAGFGEESSRARWLRFGMLLHAGRITEKFAEAELPQQPRPWIGGAQGLRLAFTGLRHGCLRHRLIG